jgi:ATP-dependent Lon protease
LAPESTASVVESSQESTPTSDKTPLKPPPPPPPNSEADDKKSVTTNERKPMEIPSSVHVRITPDNLKDYVGPPVYQKDRMYTHAPPPGVSTGLGYLGNGSGAAMLIEAMVTLFSCSVFFFFTFFTNLFLFQSMPGKRGPQLTGKLGEVIRESAQIGLSWVKSHAYDLGITPSAGDQFLMDLDVHMPEGSIGKEGPSAGTAIVSAFVSLFTKTRVNPEIGAFFSFVLPFLKDVSFIHSFIAMTGEISLVGQVLPVGGLKEKILAAHRAGIKTILAPAGNRADIEENVPESVKTGIRFVYVESVNAVLHEVFRGEPVSERWKNTLPV